ncbi:MAG: THUMP domain-containing protein, partial [Bradymonadaceae bacterium]
MPESPSQLYLVRLSGTISTKSSQTRKAFQRTLEDNIRDALEQSGDDFSVERRWNRIFVRTDSDEAVRQLTRVAGVQSIRPAVRREWDTLADIVEAGRKLFADRVEDRTFAVRARRVGHRDPFPFRSDDVKRELGRALVEAGGEVDLDAPEVEVRLELHIEEAFVYERDIPGPGGLPVGVEGRALAMISGGFDSAVAARQMLKRGVALDFVFFNL